MEKRIRSIELSDAEVVRRIYAPFVSDSATSFELEPPDAPTIAQRIRDLKDRYPWLVFEAHKEVLGYAMLLLIGRVMPINGASTFRCTFILGLSIAELAARFTRRYSRCYASRAMSTSTPE
jgi:hypothetical protein